MKKLVLCLIILLVPSWSSAQTGWRKLLNAPCFGFAANPKNLNTIYVGGEGRMFYQSFDAGKTWDSTAIGFRGGSEQLTNVLVHPVDTNVVFVGGIRFGTIRRSTDMGKNWEVVLSEIQNLTFSGEAIIFDPNNSFIMYAAEFQRGNIFKSTDRGRTWFKHSSLPLDTAQRPPQPPRICCITIHPDFNNQMFAGCTGGNIYRSDDTGRTWQFVTQLYKFRINDSTEVSDSEIPQMRFSKLQPRFGYAVSTYFNRPLLPNGSLLRTTDGGETWNRFALHDTSLWAIELRPLVNNEEIVVGGYTDVADSTVAPYVPGERIIRRSTDGGQTWITYDDKISWGISDSVKNNVFTLRYLGNTPQTQKLYAATEAGLFVFDSLNASGILPPLEKTTLVITQQDRNQVNVQFEGLDDYSPLATVSVYNLVGQSLISKLPMQRFGKKSFFAKLKLGNIPLGRYFLTAEHGDLVETISFQIGE